MTGIKIFLATFAVGLVGVIESDSIDAWAKLTAIPILGATIFALIFYNNKSHNKSLETHKEVCEGIRCSIDKIGTESKEDRDRHIELLSKVLDKH